MTSKEHSRNPKSSEQTAAQIERMVGRILTRAESRGVPRTQGTPWVGRPESGLELSGDNAQMMLSHNVAPEDGVRRTTVVARQDDGSVTLHRRVSAREPGNSVTETAAVTVMTDNIAGGDERTVYGFTEEGTFRDGSDPEFTDGRLDHTEARAIAARLLTELRSDLREHQN